MGGSFDLRSVEAFSTDHASTCWEDAELYDTCSVEAFFYSSRINVMGSACCRVPTCRGHSTVHVTTRCFGRAFDICSLEACSTSHEPTGRAGLGRWLPSVPTQPFNRSRPTNQKKSIDSERRLRLQQCGFIRGTSSLRAAFLLLATVIDTRMPIQERERWAENCFEQVDEKRDALLTIPFVRFAS